MTTKWCETLGIPVPKLEEVVGHREANTFALLLVALLERGEAMTLADVASRFEEAGIADRSRALLSLQRCKPGRPPVYREGELYHLDPRDHELDLWVLRLGLRPAKVARIVPKVVEAPVLPGPEVALQESELDEAWKDASLSSWSAQRLAVAVLDALGGPLTPAQVVAAVAARTKWHALKEDSAKFRRRDSPIDVHADGRWAISERADPTLQQVRTIVRDRLVVMRRNAAMRPSPADFERFLQKLEKERSAHAAELSALSRALLVAFPPTRPRAVALLDLGEREITTFVDDELTSLPSRLAAFDVLGAVDVRSLLRALSFDPEQRRLADLGPPQKSKTLPRGRVLKITTTLLVQGSCGITKPFGDADKLAAYLAKGDLTKVRERLAADVQSLDALYEYGRLHGAVRLRWRSLDEFIPAPWVDPDEPKLRDLIQSARAMHVPLEVVVGSAPGWEDPWARVLRVHVMQAANGWRTWLVDEDGYSIDVDAVQRARLPVALH